MHPHTRTQLCRSSIRSANAGVGTRNQRGLTALRRTPVQYMHTQHVSILLDKWAYANVSHLSMDSHGDRYHHGRGSSVADPHRQKCSDRHESHQHPANLTIQLTTLPLANMHEVHQRIVSRYATAIYNGNNSNVAVYHDKDSSLVSWMKI